MSGPMIALRAHTRHNNRVLLQRLIKGCGQRAQRARLALLDAAVSSNARLGGIRHPATVHLFGDRSWLVRTSMLSLWNMMIGLSTGAWFSYDLSSDARVDPSNSRAIKLAKRGAVASFAIARHASMKRSVAVPK